MTAVDPETYIDGNDLRPSHLKALRQLWTGVSSGLINTYVLRGLEKRGLVAYGELSIRELTPIGRAKCAELFGATP